MNEKKDGRKESQRNESFRPKMLYKVLLDEYARLKLLSATEAKDLRDLARQLRKDKDLKTEDEIKSLYPDPKERERAMREQVERRSEMRFEMLEAIRAKIHAKEHDERPAALCLSGGGIRSATFNLGVLQSLAQHKLLDKFDYLSTVSGGGYIGSWLSAWIYRKKVEADNSRPRDEPHPEIALPDYVQKVQDELCDTTPDRVEPPEITYLRSYSNFMSPRPGIASTDTWTLAAVYLRNLLLNWTVSVPLIAAVLLAPRFIEAVIELKYPTQSALRFLIFLIGVVAGIICVANIIAMRPTLERFSWLKQRYTVDNVGNLISAEPLVRKWCVLPLVVSALAMTIYWAWITEGKLSFNDQFIRDWGITHPRLIRFIIFVIFGEVLFLGGFIYAHSRLWLRRNSRTIRAIVEPTKTTKAEQFKSSLARELLISLTGGAIGGALLFWIADVFAYISQWFSAADLTAVYVCFGAPLFLTAFLLSAAFFVGAAGSLYNDMDREWLSRFGAWVLIIIFGWAVMSSVVLFGPKIFTYDWSSKVSLSVGIVSGLITLVLGFSKKSPATDETLTTSRIAGLARLAPQIAAPVFALFLMALISFGTLQLLYAVRPIFSPEEKIFDIAAESVNQASYLTPEVYLLRLRHGIGLMSSSVMPNALYYLSALFLVLIGVGALMGYAININKFSLHAMYRERLIRAYLGASRGAERTKTANSFTDFDEEDNVEMQKLRYQKPFHIVNMTLNLGSGSNLRWQNRKAESFTVSALHCGSSNMGNGTGLYRDARHYGYSPTAGEAISLGTAAAISGAAASPNMGYYSQSQAVSFLMAFFNIRLGWWLGNPGIRGDKTYNRSSPKFAPQLFFSEAFGNTNDTNPYIYLSDGGHFDNLGLYEMVLRRCHFIVVCDAGADAKFGFFDFGTAIHKIRVDMGIPIEFDKGQSPTPGRSCAVATIKYSAVDGADVEDGFLIYIKPTLDGDEPIDIVNYKSVNPNFPHETTADQMYSESQFESYRSLGFYMIDSICCSDGKSTCSRISNFLESAIAYLERKRQQDEAEKEKN